MLKELKSLATIGDVDTPALLEEFKSDINFEQDIDLALEYYVIAANYYELLNQPTKKKSELQKAKSFHDQSDNEYLKIYYHLASINKKSPNQGVFKTQIYAYHDRAKKIGATDLLIDAKIILSNIYNLEHQKDSIDYYLNESLKLANDHQLKLKKAELIYLIGRDKNRRGDTVEAQEKFEVARKMFLREGHLLMMASSMIYSARAYYKQGELEKAFRIYREAEEVFQQYNDGFNQSLVNRYIGIIYQSFDNHETAIKRFLNARETLDGEAYPYAKNKLLNNIGISYLEIGDLEKAKPYLIESITGKEKMKMYKALYHTYNCLGKLYTLERNFEAAILQYDKSIAVNKITDNEDSNYLSYIGLLNIFVQKKDKKLAEKYSQLLLATPLEKVAIHKKERFYTCLAKYFQFKKDFPKATEYFNETVTLRGGGINFLKALKIENTKREYENQKREIEILKLENENQDKTAIIEKGKFQSKLYLTILFSSFAIFFMLVKSYIQKNKAAAKQRQLNLSLNESNEKLSESNHQLEQFAHMASHDLKTPLNTITSFSSILEKSAKPKLDKDEQVYFDFIINSGKGLSFMIDDMLAYSKVGSRDLKLELIDVNILLLNVVKSLKSATQKHNVAVQIRSTATSCKVDKMKMKRVFQNLILNGIKFHDPMKNDRLVIIDYEKLTDFHQFSITDNGIGIPKTDKNIFLPFTYLNKKEDYEGTGMGLAMCEKIIHKHGGRIWYESVVGKGTTFFFTIKI